MKSIVAATTDLLNEYLECGQTSFLLPLENYSVSYEKTYSLEDIKKLKIKYSQVEFFVVMNKTVFNDEIEEIESILEELEGLSIQGIFFYDLAFLELQYKRKFQMSFVWNQTHMVTNSRTCDFYLQNGVDYAVIAGELSKEEILELVEKTKMKFFYTLVSKPIVAHSRRSLLTNYEKINGCKHNNQLNIYEKVGDQNYLVTEEKAGTSFFSQMIPNHYSILENLKVDYVILNESYMDHTLFMRLLKPTNLYLQESISIDELLAVVNKILGVDSIFLNNKTIYRVKKEGK